MLDFSINMVYLEKLWIPTTFAPIELNLRTYYGIVSFILHLQNRVKNMEELDHTFDLSFLIKWLARFYFTSNSCICIRKC